MTVTKEQAQCFSVSSDHGWGKIFLKHGMRDGAGWCFVSVVSDFGNFGHYWSNTGTDALGFLQRINFDYAMGKFMGPEADVFDVDATVAGLRETIVEQRRWNDLSKADARDLWDSIDAIASDAAHNKDVFLERLAIAHDWSRRYHEHEVWNYVRQKANPQAVGFWEHIWTPFITAFKEERATA